MLVKRTDGTEKKEPFKSLNNGKVTADGIVSIQLGLSEMVVMLDMSPTQLRAAIVRIKKYFYDPTKGRL